MINSLYDSLDTFSTAIRSAKENITCFWNARMETKRDARQENKIEKPIDKKTIDPQKSLDLENIAVLKVSNSETDEYMISMLGLSQNNCEERVLLRSSTTEMSVLERCVQKNLNLARKNISVYMPENEMKMYNDALALGQYEYCLDVLESLQNYLNTLYARKRKVRPKLKGKGKLK